VAQESASVIVGTAVKAVGQLANGGGLRHAARVEEWEIRIDAHPQPGPCGQRSGPPLRAHHQDLVSLRDGRNLTEGPRCQTQWLRSSADHLPSDSAVPAQRLGSMKSALERHGCWGGSPGRPLRRLIVARAGPSVAHQQGEPAPASCSTRRITWIRWRFLTCPGGNAGSGPPGSAARPTGQGSRLRTSRPGQHHWEKDRCSKKVIFDGAHSFVLRQWALLLPNSESWVPHSRSPIRARRMTRAR
jgi:hypothetical protein